MAASALVVVMPLYVLTSLIWSDYLALNPSDPAYPRLYGLIWCSCAFGLSVFNLVAGTWLAFWPVVKVIKFMAFAAAAIVVSTIGFWL
jgi:hypothetical protein